MRCKEGTPVSRRLTLTYAPSQDNRCNKKSLEEGRRQWGTGCARLLTKGSDYDTFGPQINIRNTFDNVSQDP